MMRFQVITPWVQKSFEGTSENVPAISEDYSIKNWSDVTGQPSGNLPTNPNAYVLECIADDAVFAQIEADTNYYVLWSEVM